MTISHARARQVYDSVGRRYDWAAPLEAEAKRRALRLAGVRPGEVVLEVGCGTGWSLARLAAAAGRTEGARVAGVDLSGTMLAVTRERLRALGRADVPLLQADATALPFAAGAFDLIFSSYMLDLLPVAEVEAVLRNCHRLLRPGGRIVLVGLTPGERLYGRLFTAGYRWLFRRQPALLGGCRPLRLEPYLRAAGFTLIRRLTLTRGHPSEVLAARR